MTVVVAALVVVVLLLSVMVAGLLRSHATILRQLHELRSGTPPDPGVATTLTPPRTRGDVPAPPADVPDGRPAVDVTGTGPRGESIAIRTRDVPHDTLLVFLSTGCSSCSGFWADLARRSVPSSVRVVVVTRDADQESPAAVAEVAPPDIPVVMSTRTWDLLQVPGSPFVVHVHGQTGRVIGEGTAASWEQVLDLFLRAASETGQPGRKAGADTARERALDRVLLEAGITPGDPSLYGDDSGDGRQGGGT